MASMPTSWWCGSWSRMSRFSGRRPQHPLRTGHGDGPRCGKATVVDPRDGRSEATRTSYARYRVPPSALGASFRTRTSTRRFCWRPAGVSFSTIGYFGP